jgi:hypothetical protein
VRRLSVLLLAVALAAAGCSSDGASSGQPPPSEVDLVPADPPTPFHASTTKVPDGDGVAQCSDLRRPERSLGLAARFVVPAGYHATGDDGASCGFAAGRFGTEFYVSFGPKSTLKAEKERDLDPREDEGGDDSVSDISYAADVPVFGTHAGERLDYYCSCDGQDLDYRTVQARGVRLTWITPHGKQARREPAYDAVTASMALVRSDRSTCRSRGRTVTFRPPIPQTESIDFYSERCHLYLRPGRDSLLRYAEIELRPRSTLAERAGRLRARPHVVSVRYQPGAGRLTWVVVRDQVGPYGEPAGRWRAVTLGTADVWVTWSAHPRQWRTESDDARRFFDSVRPRSGGGGLQ